MNLKSSLNEFRETLRLSRTNAIDGDPRTYTGREMQRKQAIVALPEKTKQLTEALKPVAYIIFVDGPNASEVGPLASEHAEIINVDVSAALNGIVDAVDVSIPRGREFGLNSFFVLEDQLKYLQQELGLNPVDLYFSEVVVCPTKTDVATLVESYVKKFFGANFLVAIITQKVLEASVSLIGDSPVVPVFIKGVSKDFSDSVGPKVLGGKFSYFFAGEDVDQKEVVKLFTQIKKNLKNQKDN